MSHLLIIDHLEQVAETQQKAILALATRLAELGDTETGKDEIAEADKLFRRYVRDDQDDG